PRPLGRGGCQLVKNTLIKRDKAWLVSLVALSFKAKVALLPFLYLI
ncbi:hypothetical protein HMPREF3203_02035, partial [Proteus mirabilis]